LIREALENHATVCRDCLPYNPYWALRAAAAADEDMNALEATVDPPTFRPILATHGWISALRAKHSNHRIGLKSVFRVVVPGTSGTTRPDFVSVSRRGDRIKDGSVVWENAGKYSYCLECNEFLSAPKGSTREKSVS
jgi:hypothetical protein